MSDSVQSSYNTPGESWCTYSHGSDRIAALCQTSNVLWSVAFLEVGQRELRKCDVKVVRYGARKKKRAIFRVELHFPNPKAYTLLTTYSFLGPFFFF